ncbi:MAG: calcium-translocating P-type ATPase, PMCA-type [Clostridia bacterium]|nr:calcium-translocating P-type ATPase, PMCA-type [Clostridia bacterium]
MDWHSISATETAEKLKTNIEKGLSENEAKKRLEKIGSNTLQSRNKPSVIKRFLAQFKDFCVIILFVACIISFATGFLEGKGDFVEPIVILSIVFANAVIGVIQEQKAEKAIEALQKMSAPTACVIRGGQAKRIPASLITVGDIICLESGDMVPADCRLITANGLRIQESALTGESVPCTKDASAILENNCAQADRKNMIYSSTTVMAGNCTAIVTETGMNTKVGKIADLLADEDAPLTPLQQRLAKVGKALGIGAVAICAVVFILGIIRKSGILPSFMLAVSLAVAAIPEGLPAVVTVVLSMGVQRMAKSNAIIRFLPAVETLGAATVICSDKTGTLTQNRMTVTKIFSPSGETKADSSAAQKILLYAALCSNAKENKKGKITELIGDPTETALLSAALSSGIRPDPALHVRRYETPFSGERKRMSVVCSVDGKDLLLLKGAPDVVLPRCVKYLSSGGEIPLTSNKKQDILRQNELMAKQALRVIAVAYRTAESRNDSRENDLVFAGMLGMTDPPRPEAAKAVSVCKKAGITPVMITGDHISTACAIADSLGISDKSTIAMTGNQLDALSDSELQKAVENCRVFARVTPEHKVRIVKAFRARGETVAMTGDGVNDAPALKAADIGCAMGKSGTDVAKNAADMILTDDNFATIVKAVEQGRGIYDNIKKAVHFLLGTNIGEIIAVFAASVLGFGAPLLPIQLLWVNLVTDSLPAIALGTEKTESNIMRRKPVPPSKGFFSDGLWLDITLEGAFVGALTLLAHAIGNFVFGGVGGTMAFCTLSFCEISHAVNTRSYEPVLGREFFSNRMMNLAIIVCTVLQAGVVCLPGIAPFFGTVPLNMIQWATVIALSSMPLIIGEISKRLFR